MSERKKVAVLGGGMGSLAAVFAITSQPGWRERFEITVYQLGFRLGGKGASGRELQGEYPRIEEHGLHIWLGHYENAFRVMRACYTELAALDPTTQTWDEAFKPFFDVMLMERHDQEWKAWPIPSLAHDGKPGGGDELPFPFRALYAHRPPGEVARMAELYNLLLAPVRLVGSPESAPAPGSDAPENELMRAVNDFFGGGHAASGTAPDAAAPHGAPDADLQAWSDGPDRCLSELEQSGGSISGIEADGGPRSGSAVDWVRRGRTIWNFARAMARGIVRDRLIQRGYQAVDDQEFAEYLRSNGATEETLRSALVVGGYQLAFAFPRGNVSRPAFAAGTGVRCMLLLGAACKGALFWKMQGAMGDIVFTPFYRVLKQRGVKFEFFHAVRNLSVSGNRVSGIELGRQVSLKAGVAAYEPLAKLEVAGRTLWAWPNRPLYDQLDFDPNAPANQGKDFESHWRAPPDVEVVRLRDGEHFDVAILGIPPGSFPHLARELPVASPRFAKMMEHLKTVQTKALQLWFRPTLPQLGWTLSPPILDGFAEPFDTWADMSHLLPQEGVPASESPRTLAYLCAVLPDEEETPGTPYDVQLHRSVQRSAIDWLERSARFLWPNATADGRFDWRVLRAPAGQNGPARLESQYYRANVSPSERYVLSVPGSTKFRLRANESGFENLLLAGDWLRTGLSAGCIEAATMGGLQAAAALTGTPQQIVRDDEPV